MNYLVVSKLTSTQSDGFPGVQPCWTLFLFPKLLFPKSSSPEAVRAKCHKFLLVVEDGEQGKFMESRTPKLWEVRSRLLMGLSNEEELSAAT